MFAAEMEHTDEWYNFDAAPADAHVLIDLDENSYSPGPDAMHGHVGSHPSPGTKSSMGALLLYRLDTPPKTIRPTTLFLSHVTGAIEWAAGKAPNPVVMDSDGPAAVILKEFDGTARTGSGKDKLRRADLQIHRYAQPAGHVLLFSLQPTLVRRDTPSIRAEPMRWRENSSFRRR